MRILGLSEALRRYNIHLSLLIPSGPAPIRSYARQLGVNVYDLPLDRFRWSHNPAVHLRMLKKLPLQLFYLVRFLQDNPAHIVHVHGLYQPQGAVAARLAKKSVVWHLNDLLLPRPLIRLLVPEVLMLSDATICVSNAVHRYMFGSGRPLEQSVTIYDPPIRVGNSRLAATGDVLDATQVPIILTVGNLYRVKGQADLVKAAALMKQAALIQIVGGALDTQPEVATELERMAGALRGSVSVRLLGWRDDITSLLDASALYVHPSLSEACPLAILEAMAAGKAVVATAVGGVPELVEHGRTGLLVPPANPAALADALDTLLGDPELRQSYGENARLRVAREFSLERCAALHAEVYRRVAERGRRP